MKAIMVKEKTKVYAVSFEDPLKPKLKRKITNKNQLYLLNEVKVDPKGELGIGPDHHSAGSSWADEGFYGFQLPENDRNYELMLVHISDLEMY